MLRDRATKCANSSGAVLPNKKTAVRRNIRRNSGYLSHVARQRNDMRPSSNAVLPNKKTAVRRKNKTTSRMLRDQRNDMRQLQRRHSVTYAVYSRRDDRAMMTKKEPGEVNSRSRVSRLF